MNQERLPEPERRTTWRLRIAYVGTQFYGWQHQDGLRTVQGCLQDAFGKLAKEPVHVQGAGRTDAQVHAMGQVAHCTLTSRLTAQKLLLALSHLLPEDISVLQVNEEKATFHAKKDSVGKKYMYRFLCHAARNPFLHQQTWHQRGTLNVQAMQTAAQHFIGEHNFDSFRSSHCAAANADRYIWKAAIKPPDSRGVMVFEVRGNAFCQHMVRIMAGTLLEVGRGRFKPDDIPAMLKARDRRQAGMTAPGKGLTLEEVYYPDDLSTADIPVGARFPGYPVTPDNTKEPHRNAPEDSSTD